MVLVDPVLAEQRNFQFLHRIPRIPQDILAASYKLVLDRLSIPSPDSTERGALAVRIELAVNFQFLHRIPHSVPILGR